MTQPPTISCGSCKGTVEDGALFCPHCGEPFQYRTPDVDPFIGRTVSQHYKIVQRLARGGMGEVYLARHVEIEQSVAVKFLHRRFADDEELAARFFNEARSACKVTHHLAVTIYDFGRLDDGTLYLVMEYVEGIPLAEMIRRDKRLGTRVCKRIAQLAAEALAHAHEKGVVHRDIKPDNIMVIEAPISRLSIKLLDFGIAKMLDEEASGALTQTGMMFGTPEYMSPEQASGEGADHRSDIYALGLVMYEMLVGHPPFRGKNKLALLQRHIGETPPSLDDACPMRLPKSLVGLVDRCLAKEPEDRPQSMEEVLTALEQVKLDLNRVTDVFDIPVLGEVVEGARMVPLGESGSQRDVLTHNEDWRDGSVNDIESEKYVFGDDAHATGRYTFGGEDFHDTPYGTGRRTGRGAGAGVAVFFGAIAIAAIIAGALWAIDRSTAELDGLATAVVDDGSGEETAEGSGTTVEGSGYSVAVATEAERQRQEALRLTEEARVALQPVRQLIARGAIPDADETLQGVEAREDIGDHEDVAAIRHAIGQIREFQREIEWYLRDGECHRADERVITLRDRYSRQLAMTYYGRLDDCRAARRPTPAPPTEPDPGNDEPDDNAPDDEEPDDEEPTEDRSEDRRRRDRDDDPVMPPSEL